MATASKKIQTQETPSERFERVVNKVMARQRRARERREKQLRELSQPASR